MSLLEVEVFAASVEAVLSGARAEAAWSDSLQSLWRAADQATRAVRNEHADSPTECVVLDLSDVGAIWDLETLGAAHPPLTGADSFADRLHALRTTEPHLWAHVEGGRYAIGTLGGYLIARMTRGIWHAISAPTAERLGIAALTDVPGEALPDVLPAGTQLGRTDRSFAGLEVALTL